MLFQQQKEDMLINSEASLTAILFTRLLTFFLQDDIKFFGSLWTEVYFTLCGTFEV